MKIHLLTCTLLLGCISVISAQEADTLATVAATPDTTEARKSVFSWFSEDYPVPGKALILSAIPGGGQAYNKKWWKIPIVYGGLGGMIYLIDRNSTEYLYFKRAYRRKVRGLPHDLTGRGGLDNATTLRTYRDQADRNTQLSYIGFIAVYALAGVEAFVDSHLATFDVSDDLSLDLRTKELGISLSVRIK